MFHQVEMNQLKAEKLLNKDNSSMLHQDTCVKMEMPETPNIKVSIEKTKRKSLTLQQKFHILKLLEANTFTKSEISKQFGVDRSTIRKIELRKARILQAAATDGASNCQRKYVTTGRYKDLEEALFYWIQQLREENEPVTTSLILSQARIIATEMQIGNDFKFSENWVRNFKKRYGLRNADYREEAHDEAKCCAADMLAIEHSDEQIDIKQEIIETEETQFQECPEYVMQAQPLTHPECFNRCARVSQELTHVIEWAEDNQLELNDILHLKKIRNIALEHCKTSQEHCIGTL